MRPRLPLNATLVQQVRALPKVDAHNRLMRMTDRQIALSMMYMENPDRSYIMGLLPPGKVNRIREELTMHGRLAIGYPQYAAAVDAVLEGLSPGGNGGRFRSYLRPRRYVR